MTGRSFRVRIGNHLSEKEELIANVPLNAILSPLLFNIMMSDFFLAHRSLSISVLLYKDDVEVIAKTPEAAERNLQKFLDVINRWVRK